MGRLLLLLWLAGTLPHGAIAQDVLVVDSHHPSFDTGLNADWLADPTRQLTLADVATGPARGRFQPVGHRYPNAGFTLNDYWLRVRVRFAPDFAPTERLFLENTYPITTRLELFVVDSSGRVIERHRATSGSLGDRREIQHPHFVFTTLARPGQTLTIYVHNHCEMGLQYIPLTIWREAAFINYTTLLHFGWGAYFGFALLALLLQTMMWLFTNERRYLYVGLTVLCYLLYETSRGVGLGVRYLWPDNPWLLAHGLPVFFTAWTLTYLAFLYETLHLRYRSPAWRRVFVGIALTNVMGLLLTLPDWFLSRALVPTLQGLLTVPVMLGTGVYIVQQGQSLARYYVLGTLSLFAGGILLALSRSGILVLEGNFSAMIFSVGSLAEIFFLTLGVAAQSRRERRAKRLAQAQQQETQQQIEAERRQRELAEAEARLIARIDERRALADELHDNLGSLLFGLQLRLNGLASQPSLQADDMRPVQEIVSKTHQRVRLIAHNLMPDELSRQGGLQPALTAFIEELNNVSPTTFGLYVDRQTQHLSLAVQFALYNIAFELLQNVLRHAQATQASLQVRCTTKNTVLLTAQDNGVGLPKHHLPDNRAFATIRRRTAANNGHFTVSPVAGGGTRVVIELPAEVSFPE